MSKLADMVVDPRWAIETTYILPLVSFTVGGYYAAIHAAIFGGLLVAVMWNQWIVAAALFPLGSAVGIASLSISKTAWAERTVIVCPSAYFTAWPLWKSQPIFAMFIVAVNLVTVAGIVVLSVAVPLHEAWGCYPPSTPVRDYWAGMCITAPPNTRWYPPVAEVCGMPGVTSDCTASLTPYKFFGRLFAFVIHWQALAVTAWLIAMLIETGGALEMPASPKFMRKSSTLSSFL